MGIPLPSEALDRFGFESAPRSPVRAKTNYSSEGVDRLHGDSLGPKGASVRHATQQRRDLRRADFARSADCVLRMLAGVSQASGLFAPCEPSSMERGAVSVTRRLIVLPGEIALTGDASGSVDAITGEGLCLSFHQAIALADANWEGNHESYQRAHRQLARRRIPGRLLLLLDRYSSLRKACAGGLAKSGVARAAAGSVLGGTSKVSRRHEFAPRLAIFNCMIVRVKMNWFRAAWQRSSTTVSGTRGRWWC